MDLSQTGAIGLLLLLIGAVLALASIGCGYLIVFSAFQDATWKGIACLLCGWYLTYYMWTEFEHERRSAIVCTTVLGGAIAGVLISIGYGMMSG